MTHPYAVALQAIIDEKPLQFFNLGEWYSTDAVQLLYWISRKHVEPEHIRVKPVTITVGKHEINAPMREAPRFGTTYYAISSSEIEEDCWCNDSAIDRSRMNIGNCWHTQEDAEAAWRAIAALLTGREA